MNDILKNYTQEEIEALAIKQIENNNLEENSTLKIIEIDKEYKKHNRQAVKRAIFNGSVILLCVWIVLNSNSNISSFGTEDLKNIFDSFTQLVSNLPLPKSDLLAAFYAKMFDGINYIIEKIGLMGIVLATKSIKFILSSVKDTRQTLKMKQELLDLKESIEKMETVNNQTK